MPFFRVLWRYRTRAANEQTAFRPKSPYGVAKAAAISLVTNYRESYGLFACSGVLFNHESPLRPSRFVTRKVAKIGAGSRERLALGNLTIRRDWGWAPDYVEAIWKMLQCDHPDDFVVASGVSHSLEEFVATAFARSGSIGAITLTMILRWYDQARSCVRSAIPQRRRNPRLALDCQRAS